MGWESRSTSLTASSQSDPFPLVSDNQAAVISTVIDALPPAASTWSAFTETYTKLGIDESEYYSLFLKLSLEVGRDWREKWLGAKASLEDRGVRVGGSKGGTGARGQSSMPLGGMRGKRAGAHDALRARLEEVKPVPRGSPSQRPPSTPPATTYSSPRPLPPTTRPKSTSFGPTVTRKATAARPFLVESNQGASSSDDYAGVPARPHRSHLRAETKPDLANPRPRPAVHERSLPPPSAPRPLPPSHFAPQPTKSALSARRPVDNASPSAPVKSFSLPTELEDTADRFRRFTLISRAWLRWREYQAFVLARETRLEKGLRIHLLKWSFDLWRERLGKALELQRAAERADDVRMVRERALLFMVWKRKATERVRDRRHREREERLLKASITVRATLAKRLAGEVLQHWYYAMLRSRATRFHQETLAGLVLTKWKSRTARLAEMASKAAELAAASDEMFNASVFNLWRQNTALLTRERHLVEVHDSNVRRDWWELWKKQTNLSIQKRLLEDKADQFKSWRRGTSALRAWRRRLENVRTLSNECDALIARKDAALVAKTLDHWTAEYSGFLLFRARQVRLARHTLARWKARHDFVTIDLASQANAMLAVSAAGIQQSCLAQWKDALRQHQSQARGAEVVSARTLVARTLGRWRAALVDRETRERKADVAADFFLVQRMWGRWNERVVERKVAAHQEKVKVREKREVFLLWLGFTRKAKSNQVLVETFQQGVDQRVCKDALKKWETRVIDIRSREIKTRDNYDLSLVRSAFANWTEAILRHGELYSLLESALFVRDQKLLRRSFRHWLKASRKAVDLQRRLDHYVEAERLATLEVTFDRWRERSLRDREQEVVVMRQERVLSSAWKHWRLRTKSLPAIQFDKMRSLRRAFEAWQAQISDPALVTKGVDIDTNRCIGKCFEVWRIKYEARVALQRVRTFGYSPGASSFVPAPLRALSAPPPPHASISPPSIRSPSFIRFRASYTPPTAPSPPATPRLSDASLPLSSRRQFVLGGGDTSTFSSRSSQDDSENRTIEDGLRARLRTAAANRRRSVYEGT